MERVRWRYLLLYSATAFAISAPFNTRLIYQWLPLQAPVSFWRDWLFAPAALGPCAAAFLCYRLDHATPRRITLTGKDGAGSLLTAFIPLVFFTLAGYADGGAARLLPTLLTGCAALIYALGEEAGWRGYLQDALVSWSARQRYLFVGILWWAWHMRFAGPFDWTVFPLIVIASAFVLGHVAETNRSLLVVASMHSVIMLLTMHGSASPAFYAAGAMTLLGWMVLRRLRPDKGPAEPSPV